MKRSAALLGVLLVAGLEARLEAQQSVTIKQINAIPRDNIQELMRGAVSLDERDIRELVTSPFEGREVAVFAVVMSDPRNSGSAAIINGRVSRVHFFVRDVAADLEGTAGMGLHVIDDRWEEHRVIDLSVGDVVGITGTVSKSQFGLYLDPGSIERVGRYDSLGLGHEILAPETTFSIDDLNRDFADGTFQANWAVYPDVHGSLVCLDRAVVIGGVSASPSRAGWGLSSSGAARAYVSDLSLRYRSDESAYPPGFNVRPTPFEAPRSGSTVSICGFVVLQAFNDPDGVGRPLASSAGSMLSLAPMEDSDLEILEVPPEITSVSRPDAVLNSSQAFSVSATVTPDPARSIRRVRLHYTLDSQTVTKGMVGLPDGKWTISIPPARRDGAVVEYRVSALDSEGAEVRSRLYAYRVLDGGLDSVSDIQETANGGVGPSLFEDLSLPMNLSGVIQSDPLRSGLVVFQDDSLLKPWSGVLLDRNSVKELSLRQGDRLLIRRGRITEVNGNTIVEVLAADLSDRASLTFPRVVVTTTDLSRPEIAESYEGMFIRVEDASLLEQSNDTTWTAWSGSIRDAVEISTESPSVSNEELGIWQTYPFIDGAWIQRGGSWILVPGAPSDFGEVINVAVDDEHPEEARTTVFDGTYPNPFLTHTSVAFVLGRSGAVRIDAFDLAGRKVAVLADERFPAGRNEIVFDAASLAPGPYLLRLTSNSGEDSAVVIRLD